ncbi:MAG: GntR family transcriptional regulator [Pseudomonadota bacterium]
MVAEFSPEFIMDHYAVREVLEGLAARLAAHNATELELMQLTVELEAMARASKANDLEQLAHRNADFYLLIAKASRNVVVTELLTILQDRLRLLRDFNFRATGRRDEALREQRSLLTAIEARDADKAEQFAKSLVGNARQARLSALGASRLATRSS